MGPVIARRKWGVEAPVLTPVSSANLVGDHPTEMLTPRCRRQPGRLWPWRFQSHFCEHGQTFSTPHEKLLPLLSDCPSASPLSRCAQDAAHPASQALLSPEPTSGQPAWMKEYDYVPCPSAHGTGQWGVNLTSSGLSLVVVFSANHRNMMLRAC